MMDAVNITMSDCTFRNNTGTAVFLEDSFLECSGHSEFTANIGYEGACLSLGEGSRIFLATNETRLTFAHNTANYTGGAIQHTHTHTYRPTAITLRCACAQARVNYILVEQNKSCFLYPAFTGVQSCMVLCPGRTAVQQYFPLP